MKYRFDDKLVSSFTEAMNQAHAVETKGPFDFGGRLYVMRDDGKVSVRTVDGCLARSVFNKNQIRIHHAFGHLIENLDNSVCFTVLCKTSVDAALKLLWASIKTVELSDE